MPLSSDRRRELFAPMLADPPRVSQFYVEAHMVLSGIEDTTDVSFPNLASHKVPVPQSGILVPEAHYVISDGSLGDPLTYSLQSCVAVGFHDKARQKQLLTHIRQLSRLDIYFSFFSHVFGDLSQTVMSVVSGYDQRYDNFTTMKQLMYIAKAIKPKRLIVDVSPERPEPRAVALSFQTGEQYELGGNMEQAVASSSFHSNDVKPLPNADEPFILPF